MTEAQRRTVLAALEDEGPSVWWWSPAVPPAGHARTHPVDSQFTSAPGRSC